MNTGRWKEIVWQEAGKLQQEIRQKTGLPTSDFRPVVAKYLDQLEKSDLAD
jgi:hypothetical protein